jgi:hypothetical protein
MLENRLNGLAMAKKEQLDESEIVTEFARGCSCQSGASD